MKIYCKTSRFADPQEELDYYIRKICNRDLWLAVKQEDTYYKWIRAYSNGDKITFSSVYNSAWYPEKYFYGEEVFGDKMPTDYTAEDINLSECEVVHPVQTYSTEELVPYICGEDEDRYRFSDYAPYDSRGGYLE